VEGDKVNGVKVMGDKIVQMPPPPEPGNTIGHIPPAKAVTYVHRGKIEEDVCDFLEKGNGTGAIVGLHAPGGLGKTELAKHAAEELKGQFDGILWVDVGEKTPEQVVADMLIKCGVQLPPGASYEQQKNELHSRLQGCKWLVILDDVRQKALEGLADFLPSKPCAALITSRIQQISRMNKILELDHMTPEQAAELMEAVLGEDVVAAEKEAAEKLAIHCAYNPLALEIAARRVRQLEASVIPLTAISRSCKAASRNCAWTVTPAGIWKRYLISVTSTWARPTAGASAPWRPSTRPALRPRRQHICGRQNRQMPGR